MPVQRHGAYVPFTMTGIVHVLLPSRQSNPLSLYKTGSAYGRELLRDMLLPLQLSANSVAF